MTLPSPSPSPSRGATVGAAATTLLLAAAFVVPPLLGWQVWPRLDGHGVAPLHALWSPEVGVGTLPAVVIAGAGLVRGEALAHRLSWGRLLVASYVVGLGWLIALALVRGTAGVADVLGSPSEYLRTARAVHGPHDLHRLLQQYVDRIPFSAGDRHWPIHVAGHPPGMLLFFVVLVWLGLGSGLAAGLVVTAIAATLPLAVLTTLRSLGEEPGARRAAPYLVLTPAAVFLAVSADAVMATTVAWGMACLAVGAGRGGRRGWPLVVLAGVLLGGAVMMSYGLPLVGLVALAILFLRRTWWPLVVAAGSALAVVLAFAVAGFAWWEAYPVLVRRYWDGLASRRPGAYWTWGDLAALAVSAGPAVGAGLGAAWASRRTQRVVAVLVAAGVGVVVLADVSQMSRAEVERIWLPFVPWLTVGLATLPRAWRRPALAVQLATALAVEHLLYTTW